MKELINTTYQCDYCGVEYETPEACKSCEDKHPESKGIYDMPKVMEVISIKAHFYKITPKTIYDLVNNGTLLYVDEQFERNILYGAILERLIKKASKTHSSTDFIVDFKDGKMLAGYDGVYKGVVKLICDFYNGDIAANGKKYSELSEEEQQRFDSCNKNGLLITIRESQFNKISEIFNNLNIPLEQVGGTLYI